MCYIHFAQYRVDRGGRVASRLQNTVCGYLATTKGLNHLAVLYVLLPWRWYLCVLLPVCFPLGEQLPSTSAPGTPTTQAAVSCTLSTIPFTMDRRLAKAKLRNRLLANPIPKQGVSHLPATTAPHQPAPPDHAPHASGRTYDKNEKHGQ